PFFQYEWKKEMWNFFFVGGIFVGAFLAVWLLANPDPVALHPALAKELAGYGITDHSKLLPPELFSFSSLFTLRGLILLVGGGFLVGFGTRYAGGCTSGHSIMGLSNLQLPSLIATISFMAGGFIMANWILPLILSL
ncbi:MAG: YeeE/YedE family protein, partial [Chitinophagaceae bacterium]